MKKVPKMCTFESFLDSEAEDDARILALDLESPRTSSAVSCADLIAVVKKTKSVEVRKKITLTPRKFAEAVLKSLDEALKKVKGIECPTTVPANLKKQLEAKVALFLSVVDRANKAINAKGAKSKGVDKQFSLQLFEGMLSDTHGIHKTGRESNVALHVVARVLYHLIRENVELEDDGYLRQVWNTGS
jgi:hypothetical protein